MTLQHFKPDLTLMIYFLAYRSKSVLFLNRSVQEVKKWAVFFDCFFICLILSFIIAPHIDRSLALLESKILRDRCLGTKGQE